ncbi:Uncharacterized protein ToN1_04690 [Aromatoleum petrolei]|nr:Uncharacterized protein ToN1_04690 [Aromatoleum petrolei]
MVVALTPGEAKSSRVDLPRRAFRCSIPHESGRDLVVPFFFDGPAACRCTRTMVLSRNISSTSASSESRAKTACQAPLSARREKRGNTLFQGLSCGGGSRHGTPVAAPFAAEVGAPSGAKPVVLRLLTNRTAPTRQAPAELAHWYRAGKWSCFS